MPNQSGGAISWLAHLMNAICAQWVTPPSAAFTQDGFIWRLAGDDENAVAHAASEVIRIANTRVGEGFVAVSAENARRNSGSIMPALRRLPHTNAFKINEDVVDFH